MLLPSGKHQSPTRRLPLAAAPLRHALRCELFGSILVSSPGTVPQPISNFLCHRPWDLGRIKNCSPDLRKSPRYRQTTQVTLNSPWCK